MDSDTDEKLAIFARFSVNTWKEFGKAFATWKSFSYYLCGKMGWFCQMIGFSLRRDTPRSDTSFPNEEGTKTIYFSHGGLKYKLIVESAKSKDEGFFDLQFELFLLLEYRAPYFKTWDDFSWKLLNYIGERSIYGINFFEDMGLTKPILQSDPDTDLMGMFPNDNARYFFRYGEKVVEVIIRRLV